MTEKKRRHFRGDRKKEENIWNTGRIRRKAAGRALAVLMSGCLLTGCTSAGTGNTDRTGESSDADRISVVTTIFPQYDFVREIAGDLVDLKMLLKPGEETHSYEPTPQDIIAIQKSDVFIYVGGENDAWVEDILESMPESQMRTLRLMDCVDTVEEEYVEGMDGAAGHSHDHEEEHDHEDGDEHEEGERLQRFKGHSKKFVENNFMRLWFLCRLIADIQLESLRYGIVYRGAISLGNHFHSNNITFSKALVDAYLAESQKAIYPRVIILDTPENDILELAPALYEYFDIRVVADEDYLIVDYLGKIIEFLGLLDADCDYIQWHKEIIEQGINNYAEDNSILSKYAWMMNYHHIRLAPIFGEKICIQQECRNKVKEKLGLHLADLIC